MSDADLQPLKVAAMLSAVKAAMAAALEPYVVYHHHPALGWPVSIYDRKPGGHPSPVFSGTEYECMTFLRSAALAGIVAMLGFSMPNFSSRLGDGAS